MMTTAGIDEKLDEVLRLFLSSNYNVASPTYLDLLLTQISEKIDEPTPLNSKHIAVYTKWLEKASAVWSVENKPCQSIAIFAVKLIGVIGRDEKRFQNLRHNILNKICSALDLHRDDLGASLKMAYTIMVTEFVNHQTGRAWIKETGVWRDIVKFALHNHTLYVTRESQHFISSLILHESQNEKFCAEMILNLAKPLMETTMNGQTQPSLEDLYLHQNKDLCNSLRLITSILEDTIFSSLDNMIPDMFENLINLESRTRALFQACISTQFFQHIHKLWILLNIRILKQGIIANPGLMDLEIFEKFQQGLRFAQMLLLSKNYLIEWGKTLKMSLIYWTKLQGVHEFILPLEHKFEHQVIALLITPLGACIKSHYTKDHDFFEMFIDKLYDVTCHPVQRMVYNIRTIIGGNDNLPLEQICKATIDTVMELQDVMDRDLAVIAFQMMCHVLKNYIPRNCCFSNEPEQPISQDQQIRPMRKSILDGDPIVEVPVLLSALLNSIALLAEKFKFKWKECVETTCVLFLAEQILQHPGLQPKICVQALKLCKLAIQDFMPPNLALLIDSDCHTNSVGPTLYKRLHDPNWEVRDSVFETLNTIAVISEDKFPAFQNFLLVNQFLQLATDIAVTDGESYVRASALTFISTTVRINKLWDEKLSQLNLPEIAINLLKEESEGIVRKEAVTLIKELYLNRKWPKVTIKAMTEVMAEAAVLDLHWEVKVNALEYWRHVIISHLTDQGMLDGSFPNMTFSKEHRKIVALDESEIKRRLNKALEELAKQSCLGVLLATLEDESDFEVSKASAAIILRLKKFLLKYKINEPQAPYPAAKDSATLDSVYVKESANFSEAESSKIREDSSSVIDEIVDANDASLLVSLYKNSMKMEGDDADMHKETLKCISRITKDEFLRSILTNDIEAYIEERKRWLKTYTCSFESILEDIITAHESTNVNSMDCY
ncbi:uncharacterized protein [Venturia canescens]|uniref:uncharacterized protein n=1 Tax=Venturia canescens TaxID=32260 RepID=UPI001C9D0D66|nr:uncharacterized protein LOC122413944 [Venturia canescens]XP_043280573.1 uncharacterized protein LOC122413944 [Venturia canescens]XP_043280574.1 uncharacterized protein LOC122413944 [Venturia canescens]